MNRRFLVFCAKIGRYRLKILAVSQKLLYNHRNQGRKLLGGGKIT